MSSSVQPSCAETAGDPTESIDLESEPAHDNVLRPISEGLAAESETAWRACFAALKATQSFKTPYHRSSAVWAFFRLKGEDMNVDVRETQKLRCWVCHPTEAELSNSSERGTRSRKGILQYNPAHGITSMKTHVENEHAEEFSRYVRESKVDEGDTARQKSKKRKGAPPSSITAYFGNTKPYAKNDVQQQRFIEDLVLFIAKGYESLSIVESAWLRRLMMRRDPKVVCPSRKQLVREHIPAMLTKTMDRYALPLISSCQTASITFDLWMSRTGWDTFALVVNFIDDCWVPCHVTVGLFEAQDTSGSALAEIVKPLLDEFKLTDKIVACVKDEGANLATLERAMQLTVSCDILGLAKPFSSACFGHIMSKVCQYATNDEQMCKGMKEVSLKNAQKSLQSCITWTKKSGNTSRKHGKKKPQSFSHCGSFDHCFANLFWGSDN